MSNPHKAGYSFMCALDPQMCVAGYSALSAGGTKLDEKLSLPLSNTLIGEIMYN